MPDTFRKEYLQEKTYFSSLRILGLSLILLGITGCASSRVNQINEDREVERYRNPVWNVLHNSIFGEDSEYALKEKR